MNNYKILLVDDSKANLYTLETLLKTYCECTIYQALSAKEALHILLKEEIDLIISDIQMPEIDGFEFAKIVKSNSRTKHIPFIFVTAIYNSEEYRKRGYELGILDYLMKPIDENILITKLKNYISIFSLQKELQLKNSYIQSLLEASDEGQIVIDKHDTIVNYNKQATNIFKSIKNDILLKELFEDKKDFFELENFISKVGLDFQTNFIFKYASKYYKIFYKKIFEHHIISFYDVTQEIKMGKRNAKIFNSQNSIIVITDGNSMHDINNVFFETFPYSDYNDFVSKHRCICELFVEKNSGTYLQASMCGVPWNHYVLANLDSLHKVCMLDKNGEEKIYQVQSTGRVFEEDEEDEVEEIITFTDITYLLQQQQILQEQSKFAAMGEMISMIAHQWRQPLTILGAILTKMNILSQMDMLDAKTYKNQHEKSKEQISYMSETINDFRDFFNTNSVVESISIEKLISKSLHMIDTSFKEKSINNKIIYEGSIQDIELYVHSSKFTQVLLNLFKNAIDQIESKNIDNPYVNIVAKKENNYISIDIVDNAQGIPEDILPKIFDPYFSTKSKNGTGLGLYMSKIIIEEHFKGKLIAKNTVDGVCFKIQLPISA